MDNQTASREARRILSDKVRDDWAWPAGPTEPEDPVRQATDYKERFYSTTSPSGSEAEESLPSKSRSSGSSKKSRDPYKYDSPDSIATSLSDKRAERRRRRSSKLQEEMSWNQGLVCFMQRRDAWTGVTTARRLRAQKGGPSAVPQDSSTQSNGTTHAAPAAPTTDSPNPATAASSILPSDSIPDPVPLVPVAPPLIPASNPLRASIGPSTYPEIFSKVVLSARTPTVPINLADMTAALVQGWKSAGEWPPKASVPDPLVGARRKRDIIARTPRIIPGEGGAAEANGGTRHPHIKKGVESVKKVLRLSGSHSGTPADAG
ncbi:hypothetical protein H2201_005583 [Coniosporium apollinis]|uniref:Gag1-like clamp domain-containing protein n=1 Tax=Coniosporium apollinis TaxID=61459 RepID=A0ABQ9NPL2_9PEZI|nr:hypothetical protein H2201_005583 [Coniosporium apollinis]